MKTPDCAREPDLLDTLASGRWPQGGDADLRAHVDACESCAELLAVALPLLQEQALALHDARIPSSAVVWWRAQTRARREAVVAATTPITLVQGVALACAAGLVAGVATLTQPAIWKWMAWVGSVAAGLEPGAIDFTRLQALAPVVVLPLVALAVWLLVAPLAIYFAAGDE